MDMTSLNQSDAYAVVPEFLFDARTDHVAKGMAVMVRKGRIVRVCAAGEVPEGMPRLEGPGGTLIPGLIDAHVHLDDWELPYYLAYGVTTVRDVGNNLDFILDAREKARVSSFASPTIFCCGPFIDNMPYYHANMSWGMESAADIRPAIDCLRKASVDFIKLYNDLTPELARTAVTEAKRAGFYVLGDFGKEAVLGSAIDAGLDEFEHLVGLPAEFSQQAADAVLERGIAMVATRALFENILTDRFRTPEGQAILANIPQNTADYWVSTLSSLSGDFIRSCETKREYLKYFIKNNARLGVGTDTACWWMFPGKSFADELRIHVECGLSCAGALRLATLRNAVLLGKDAEIGTIETGKRADMAFVEGDPLADIAAAGHVRWTIKGGHIFEAADLIAQSEKARPVSNSLRGFGARTKTCTDWKQERTVLDLMKK
jgi:imidazolonepropionase-like amidohydrolase